MRRLCALAILLVPATASAVPALEWEGRYSNTHVPLAGREFKYGRSARAIDGGAFGADAAQLHGGEMSFFGRGDVWAFGPSFGFAMASGPQNPWSGASTHVLHFNAGLEGRATLSKGPLTGWVGGVLGLGVTSIASGAEKVVPLEREYPRSATRLDLFLQPRVGLEYAFSRGMYGRAAVGGWGGVEPLNGSWTVGLSFSARLHLMPTTGTTRYYYF